MVFISILGFVRLDSSINKSNRDLPLSKKLQYVDTLGTLLFLGTICCLLLTLQWGGQTIGWQNCRIIGLFIGFGILLAAFSFLQWRRGDYVTIPIRVLRRRSILMGVLVLMPLGMSSFVVRSMNELPPTGFLYELTWSSMLITCRYTSNLYRVFHQLQAGFDSSHLCSHRSWGW